MKYEIIIYDEDVSFSNYDDEVYWDRTNTAHIGLRLGLQGKKALIKWWKKLLKGFEGYTYGVWADDHLICGGVLDPGDKEIIKDALGFN